MLSLGILSPGVSKDVAETPIVSTATEADRRDWDAYLDSKPRIAPFAAFGWADVLRGCYGAEPVLLAARRPEGGICGVFFGYMRTAGVGGGILYSPPFGLVSDDTAAIPALLDAARKFAAEKGVARTIISSGEQSASTPYHRWTKITLIKSLPGREEEAWDGLRKKSRYTIRRAAGSGIEIRQGFEYLRGFYAAYQSRMSEKCLALHSLSFFERMAAMLGDRAALYVAMAGNRVLGGMIFFLGRDVAAYEYNAAFNDSMALGVNHLLMWEAIRDFIRRGIRHLDLGESSPGGGVHEFKTLQFGGEPRDVFYYDVMRPAGASQAEPPPMPLTYKIGNRLIPYLPARWRRPWLLSKKRYERLL